MVNRKYSAGVASLFISILLISILLPVSGTGLAGDRDLQLAPAPGSGTPVKAAWLYVIGIEKYRAVQQLTTAVGDARAIRDLMIDKYQFDKSHLIERYDAEATRENIIDDLYNLARNLGQEDSLLIYYAGHGYEDSTLNQGYWIPVDARPNKISSYISNADIRSALSGIPSRHIFLISDSCFSGSLLADRAIPDRIDDRYYQEKYRLPSRMIMTSGGNEPVADQSGSRSCKGHSVFACYLIKYLRSNPQKYITPNEIFSQVARTVSINSNQTPVLGALRQAGHENGEFVFIAKVKNTSSSSVTLPPASETVLPPVSTFGGVDSSNLDELRLRAEEREQAERRRLQLQNAEQQKYQAALEEYFNQVSSLDSMNGLTAQEKSTAWADFLAKFPPTHATWGANPRADHARRRQSHWLAQQQLASATNVSRPSPPTPSANTGSAAAVVEYRGLVWQRQNAPTKYVWRDAKKYCDNLNLGGYSDWTLPTVEQLRLALVRCSDTISGGSCPANDSGIYTMDMWGDCTGCDAGSGSYLASVFGEAELGWYWSSTKIAKGSSGVWGVNFKDGQINVLISLDSKQYVRCVRTISQNRSGSTTMGIIN